MKTTAKSLNKINKYLGFEMNGKNITECIYFTEFKVKHTVMDQL